MKISELKNRFTDNNIQLFNAFTVNEIEIEFEGDNSVKQLIDFAKSNNVKNAFYNYEEITDLALIDIESITEYEYGIHALKFIKEANQYNKTIKSELGNIFIANITVIDNGIFLGVTISNEKVEYYDGADKLEDITQEYRTEFEIARLEKEVEFLEEIEDFKIEEKKHKIEILYSLFESDQIFNSIGHKEARIMRATQLASSIGLKDTKINISSYIEIFNSTKKLGNSLKN